MAGGRSGPGAAALAVCGAAALVGWRVALLAQWGIDESANLWMGTLIRDGHAPVVGLASSVGTRNLAGAPLVAAPLSLLPDLVAVSRALTLLQLLALAALGCAVAVRGRGRVLVLALLLFCPAPMLTAGSLWNQYLALPLTAGITALLLRLVEGRAGSGFAAATLLVTLLLLQPAVHLAGFADLIAQGGLAIALLALAAPGAQPAAVELAVAFGCSALFVLYHPWLQWVFAWTPRAALWTYGAAALAAVLVTRPIAGRAAALARRAAQWRWLSWSVPAVLLLSGASSVVTLWGAQVGSRELGGGAWGLPLLAAQVAVASLALPALPGLLADCRAGASVGALLGRWFPGRTRGAALLIANAALLMAARAALVPQAFLPHGRADLLLPLTPALLAPALLLVGAAPRAVVRTWATVVAGGIAAVTIAFAAGGVNLRFAAHAPRFVPGAEMRELVDWIAAQPGATGVDGRLDVAYDVLEGREWLIRVACRPTVAPWYTVSRPFDWLFRRRHGLIDGREGTCERSGGGRWVVTYRDAPPPPGRRQRLVLEHLVVWE